MPFLLYLNLLFDLLDSKFEDVSQSIVYHLCLMLKRFTEHQMMDNIWFVSSAKI